MIATQSLNLYNIALRYFKNEADATSFVKEIEVVVDNKFDNKKDIIASKNDITLIKDDIALLRVEAREQKIDIIKWMVALVLSSIGIITTLVAFLLNYYLKK